MAKPKLKAEIKDDEVLIWNGEQCILHLQRVSETRLSLDVYLTPHSHIWLESDSEIKASKDAKKPSRKSRDMLISSQEESGSQENSDESTTKS